MITHEDCQREINKLKDYIVTLEKILYTGGSVRDEEKEGLRERVAHWLDCYEIIQESAQRRGMAAQEAKELAKTWVAALLPASSQAWEQRAALQRRLEDQNKRLEEIARQQQEVFQGIARPQPAPGRSDSAGQVKFNWRNAKVCEEATSTVSTVTWDSTTAAHTNHPVVPTAD